MVRKLNPGGDDAGDFRKRGDAVAADDAKESVGEEKPCECGSWLAVAAAHAVASHHVSLSLTETLDDQGASEGYGANPNVPRPLLYSLLYSLLICTPYRSYP